MKAIVSDRVRGPFPLLSNAYITYNQTLVKYVLLKDFIIRKLCVAINEFVLQLYLLLQSTIRWQDSLAE